MNTYHCQALLGTLRRLSNSMVTITFRGKYYSLLKWGNWDVEKPKKLISGHSKNSNPAPWFQNHLNHHVIPNWKVSVWGTAIWAETFLLKPPTFMSCKLIVFKTRAKRKEPCRGKNRKKFCEVVMKNMWVEGMGGETPAKALPCSWMRQNTCSERWKAVHQATLHTVRTPYRPVQNENTWPLVWKLRILSWQQQTTEPSTCSFCLWEPATSPGSHPTPVF